MENNKNKCDGSIRLIYQGRVYDENGNKVEPQTTGTETQIGTSAFNEKYDDNAYVGYMYGVPNSSTYEITHENKNDSAVKQYLDNWFNNSNIKQGTSYYNKIDLNAGFCGDRQLSSGNGVSTANTNYASRNRVYIGSTNSSIVTDILKPSLACSNNDLYTVNVANKGNKALVNPVGMINADEVTFAGLIFGLNNNPNVNYLYVDYAYWTMSPATFQDDTNGVRVFRVPSVRSNNYAWVMQTLRLEYAP
ncbi:MAG: hypothetical protein NC483_05555 [Ruminococcus sp.]|nr:hypothetical protein [Ruminococcus sp.]